MLMDLNTLGFHKEQAQWLTVGGNFDPSSDGQKYRPLLALEAGMPGCTGRVAATDCHRWS